MARKTILRMRTGSYLYGLNRPESDIDHLSIFIPAAEDLLGLHKVEIVDESTKSSKEKRRNTSEDHDDVSYALPTYLHLLLGNNPNIVETLFVTSDNIQIATDEWQELSENAHRFVTKKVWQTFTGYAIGQKKKLIVKSERYKSLKTSLAQFGTTIDETRTDITEKESDLLNKTLKYYKHQNQDCESFHKGMDSKMIRDKLQQELDSYGWRVKTQSFEELQYDCKFGYHLIRIMGECEEILLTGRLNYPLTGELKDDILRVRNAEVDLQGLLTIYAKYEQKCLAAKEKSTLPEKPDWDWADAWLISTLKKHISQE